MKNKVNLGLIGLALLMVPATGFAAVDSSLNLTGTYTTGTDSLIEARLNNYTGSNDIISIFTLVDTNVNDIRSAHFLDKSGWVVLTPYQSGPDVLAKFISDTGVEVGGQRVITMRANFNTPKTYVVGYSLITADGKIISSAASPITVSGTPQFGNLGQIKTGVFTRRLTVGTRGADVTALQTRLTYEGVYSGPITGYFGVLTRAGVMRYQTAHGIQPNGVVGPQTLASLNQ